MTCPYCGCKVTYPYSPGDFGEDEGLERCANCGAIFDEIGAIEDNDDLPCMRP